ncbi:hypothetical protein CARUB_v10025574mg [Capsella rubella]|uniref:Uncharacterized protein n=2 Tax=Capsella rubella TaxID=81985 RepID=R0G1Y9_9BRAS|nr:hypothetical protein CARUB_v10025574mg [Capsella rubella]
MEKNTDGKKKTTPLIPANYISILQLQERWINEKKKKRKEEEEEERRRKQQVEEDKQREEDLKKAEEDEEKKRFNRSNQKRSGRKSQSTSGGGVKFVEKEKPEVTAVIGSGGGEDTAEMDRGFRRKRYDSGKNKKKIQDVAMVNDLVVDCGDCGSIAPSESVVTENVTPVKGVVRVYRKKKEKSVVKDAATAIGTKFEDLSIKRDETKNLKAQTKPFNNRAKQGNDLAHQRVKKPIRAASASASTMVWVKKERANNDGIASGVKPPLIA